MNLLLLLWLGRLGCQGSTEIFCNFIFPCFHTQNKYKTSGSALKS